MATLSIGSIPRSGALPNYLLYESLDKRHSGHAADQDDFVDLLWVSLASSSAFSSVGLVRSTMGCASDSSFVRVSVRE